MTAKQRELLVNILHSPLYSHPSRSPLVPHQMRVLHALIAQGLVSLRVVDLQGAMVEGVYRSRTSVYAITESGVARVLGAA